MTRPLAQLWSTYPNLATTFFKVTPNTGCLEVHFKTGLTLVGGCTFSICWRQLLSVHQARHNGIVHKPLKMRQGLEKSSSCLISSKKDVKQGSKPCGFCCCYCPVKETTNLHGGKVRTWHHPQRTGKAHREKELFSLMGSELSADTKVPQGPPLQGRCSQRP